MHYHLASLSEKGNAKDFIAATQPTVLVVLDGLFNYIGKATMSNDVDFRRTIVFQRMMASTYKSLQIMTT